MIKIALCEDDERDCADTADMLRVWIRQNGLAADIKVFKTGSKLLEALEYDVFDIYVLDIIMPELNGIELGMKLREKDSEGAIIYLTSSPDFAIESYSARAFYYLLKPVGKDKLFKVLDSAVSEIQKRRSLGMHVKTRDCTQLVLFEDVYYAERDGRAVRYVCRNEIICSVTSSAPFRVQVAPLLEDKRFFQCGASYVVNLQHIKMVDKTGALLDTMQRLELPRSACIALRSAWSDYWLGGEEK